MTRKEADDTRADIALARTYYLERGGKEREYWAHFIEVNEARLGIKGPDMDLPVKLPAYDMLPLDVIAKARKYARTIGYGRLVSRLTDRQLSDALQQVDALDARWLRAFNYRADGFTYNQIAPLLSVTASRAQQMAVLAVESLERIVRAERKVA